MSGGAGREGRSPTAPRPRRAFAPVAGSVAAVAAWLAVAHSSGAGWVQALGALLTGFLLVGLVGPALAVRRVRCRVVACPGDAVAGQPVAVALAVSGAAVVCPLDPAGPARATGRAAEPVVELVPAHRGVVTDCVLQVASAAPFGLLWWTRQVVLPLPRPLHVAPPVGAPGQHAPLARDRAGDAARPLPGRVGEPRGARPYRPGDRRNWVHWPATAHAGTLMVREMERPASRPVTVDGLLPHDPEAADQVAAEVLGTVARQLAAGRPVVLVTAEPDGRVHRPVGDVTDAGRRLARALPVRPPPVVGRRRATESPASPAVDPLPVEPPAVDPPAVDPPAAGR